MTLLSLLLFHVLRDIEFCVWIRVPHPNPSPSPFSLHLVFPWCLFHDTGSIYCVNASTFYWFIIGLSSPKIFVDILWGIEPKPKLIINIEQLCVPTLRRHCFCSISRLYGVRISVFTLLRFNSREYKLHSSENKQTITAPIPFSRKYKHNLVKKKKKQTELRIHFMKIKIRSSRIVHNSKLIIFVIKFTNITHVWPQMCTQTSHRTNKQLNKIEIGLSC